MSPVAPRRRQGRSEEQQHGEYRRKFGLKQNRITFVGRDKVEVTRRALDYWYHNPMRDGLTLIDFLHRCRISADQRKITFHVWA